MHSRPSEFSEVTMIVLESAVINLYQELCSTCHGCSAARMDLLLLVRRTLWSMGLPM